MRFGLFVSILLLVSGCSSLDSLKKRAPVATDFAGSLASEYLDYADSLSEQGDTTGAENFAAKGIAVLDGKGALPEAPGEGDTPELHDGYFQLASLSNDKMQLHAAQKLARVQLLYDCWKYQDSKNATGGPCREEFTSNMILLEEMADEFAYSQESQHIILFQPRQLVLDDGMKLQMTSIAEQVQQLPRYKLAILSYNGTDKVKRRMAVKRMRAVQSELIRQGIEKKHISVRPPNSDQSVYLSMDAEPYDEDAVVVIIKTVANSALTQP